jgi:hypothetical protein
MNFVGQQRELQNPVEKKNNTSEKFAQLYVYGFKYDRLNTLFCSR